MKTVLVAFLALLLTGASAGKKDTWKKIRSTEARTILSDSGLSPGWILDQHYYSPTLKWVKEQQVEIGKYVTDENDCDDDALATVRHFKRLGSRPPAIGVIVCTVHYSRDGKPMAEGHAANIVICSDGVAYFADYRSKVFRPWKEMEEKGSVSKGALVFF